MPKLLENKVIVITGGSQGIGSAIAKRFAAEGGKIAILDIKSSEDTVKQITEAGGQARSFETDVTNEAAVNAAIDDVVKAWEKVDILVNNAGIYPLEHFTKISVDRFRKVFNVNVIGTFICAQRVAQILIEKNIPGVILNLASAAGITPEKYHSHYAASKAAVIALTKSMALELGGYGIRVNAIAPGAIETEGVIDPGIFPDSETIPDDFQDLQIKKSSFLGRMGTPEEVANLALFLASEQANYIAGAVFSIDGGRTLL